MVDRLTLIFLIFNSFMMGLTAVAILLAIKLNQINLIPVFVFCGIGLLVSDILFLIPNKKEAGK